MSNQKYSPPIDRRNLIKDALREMDAPVRRLLSRRMVTVGSLSLLTGCSVSDGDSAEKLLMGVSRFNDRVQAGLFGATRLAPTYSESQMTRPFPFNAFYSMDKAPTVAAATYKLEVSGLVADTHSWSLDELYALPQASQVTRHICVEGWSAIGKWGGVPFATFLKRVGADLTAPFIGFKCADDYYTSIDMATALHPQTLLAFTYDGKTLPREFGFPMKLRMPTKLGYKNPKHIMALFVTRTNPGGYWEDEGYNWFGGS